MGGYHSILKKIQQKLQEKEVSVLLKHGVRELTPMPDGRISVTLDSGEVKTFDKVIATIPNPHLIPLLPDTANGFKAQLRKIEYLNLACVVLALKKSLCPYYVTNITDPGFPFTGVIEATNVVPKEVLGDNALVYLPRWMPSDDPFIKLSDAEILDRFYVGLKRIFPNFTSKMISAAHVYRDFNVQPIQSVGYRQNIPPMETGIKGLFLTNTTMILNSTLNNNQVIGLARKMAEKLVRDI